MVLIAEAITTNLLFPHPQPIRYIRVQYRCQPTFFSHILETRFLEETGFLPSSAGQSIWFESLKRLLQT